MPTRHRPTFLPVAILLPALLFGAGGDAAWAGDPSGATAAAENAPAGSADNAPAGTANNAPTGTAANVQPAAEPALLDAAGNPVFVVNDGHADKHTFNGFRQYTGNCARCHGPDGVGSSFGPALAIALSRMEYPTFNRIVTNGRRNPNIEDSVMPAFADNPNVSGCVDDIYRYLRARASGALGRGRPQRLPD